MSFKKILCAVDFSEGSRQAMLVAAQLAKESGGSLTLVHAFQIPVPGYAFKIGDPQLLTQIAENIEQTLKIWRRDARAAGAPHVDIFDAQGPPWHEIVKLAETGGYDLVVVGSHGLTGIKRALVGSVAEKVVRHAPCPVLVVKADKPAAQ